MGTGEASCDHNVCKFRRLSALHAACKDYGYGFTNVYGPEIRTGVKMLLGDLRCQLGSESAWYAI